MQTAEHEGALPATHSFVSTDAKNVVITAVKKAEDADALIVRFYEYAGTAGNIILTVPGGATAATATNLMEKPEGPALQPIANHVTVPVTPYQIQTVRIDYKAATPTVQ